jgi:type IV pilus assembly protein PilX
MKTRKYYGNPSPGSQRGVSLIVALIMLIVLTLIGVSSMNTAIVELKMAGSAQQQGIALNRADEMLRVGENDVQGITDQPAAFDFSTADDGYYVIADAIDVFDLDWEDQGLIAIQGITNDGDTYVNEYLGAKAIPGETIKVGTDGRIVGGAVHTFRLTSRSTTGKSALRLVQSIFVTRAPP